jgi:hypothetical protein
VLAPPISATRLPVFYDHASSAHTRIEPALHISQFVNWLASPIRAFPDLHDDDETTADSVTDVMPDDSEEVIFPEQQCFDQVLQTAADSLDQNSSTKVENLDLRLDSAVRLLDSAITPPLHPDYPTLPAVYTLEQMKRVKARLAEIRTQLHLVKANRLILRMQLPRIN